MKTMTFWIFGILLIAHMHAQNLGVKWIEPHLKQIEKRLQRTERDLENQSINAEKNAKKTVLWAQQRVETLRRDYRGKFDPDHPEFLKIVKEIAALQQKLSPQTNTNTTQSQVQATTDLKHLGINKISYQLQAIEKTLQKTQIALNNNSINAQKNALQTISTVQKKLYKLNSDYRGKFDPQHPRMLKIMADIENLSSTVDNKKGHEVSLRKLLPVLKEHGERLKKSWKTASYLSSSKLDLDAVRADIDEMNRNLTQALEVVTEIRRQFPNEILLSSEVGNDVNFYCLYTEDLFQKWQGVANRTNSQHFNDIHVYLSSANNYKQLALKSKIHWQKKNYIDTIQQQVEKIETRLAIIKIICGTEELQKQHLQLVEQYQQQSFQLLKFAAKLQNKAVSDEKLRLQNARMPKTKYSGESWSTVENNITQICKAQFPGHRIERVVIRSDWNEKTEARWRHHRWIYGTYLYIEAWVCKTHNNKTSVHSITLRRTKLDNGQWSALQYWSIGDSYGILEENIHK